MIYQAILIVFFSIVVLAFACMGFADIWLSSDLEAFTLGFVAFGVAIGLLILRFLTKSLSVGAVISVSIFACIIWSIVLSGTVILLEADADGLIQPNYFFYEDPSVLKDVAYKHMFTALVEDDTRYRIVYLGGTVLMVFAPLTIILGAFWVIVSLRRKSSGSGSSGSSIVQP